MSGIAYKLIVAFSLVILGMALKTLLENEDIYRFLYEWAPWVAVVSLAFLIFIGLCLWLSLAIISRFTKRKLRIESFNNPDELARSLFDYISNPNSADKPTAEARRTAAAAYMLQWFMRWQAKQFFIGLIVMIGGGIGGALGFFLLYEQNQRIDLQTRANVANAILLEGTRRSAQSSIMFSLFDLIRDEAEESVQCGKTKSSDLKSAKACWTEVTYVGAKSNEVRRINNLSKRSEKRVKSFAEQSVPYPVAQITLGFRRKYIDLALPIDEQFRHQLLSPERGLLLYELALNSFSLRDINFRFAMLSGMNLTRIDLRGIDISAADFESAKLRHTNFSSGTLSNANFSHSSAGWADFRSATLWNADFSNAHLSGADFSSADLRGASFKNAILTNVKFGGAKGLDDINFDGAWMNKEHPADLPPDILKKIAACEYVRVPGKILETTERPDDC